MVCTVVDPVMSASIGDVAVCGAVVCTSVGARVGVGTRTAVGLRWVVEVLQTVTPHPTVAALTVYAAAMDGRSVVAW